MKLIQLFAEFDVIAQQEGSGDLCNILSKGNDDIPCENYMCGNCPLNQGTPSEGKLKRGLLDALEPDTDSRSPH